MFKINAKFAIIMLAITSLLGAAACSNLGRRSISNVDRGDQYSFSRGPGNPSHEDVMQKWSTGAGALKKPTHAYMLKDNDASFMSKLKIIRSATESIDMIYYIFNTDESSSLFAQELINKAENDGVKVRILIDYLTNFKRMPFYEKLASHENIDIRFFNRPTKNTVLLAEFLTTQCDPKKDEIKMAGGIPTCGSTKFKNLERKYSDIDFDYLNATSEDYKKLDNRISPAAKMFLTGLYAKNPMIIAKVVSESLGIDPLALKESGASSDINKEEVAQMFEVFKLYGKSKLGNFGTRIESKVKLFAASIMYGKQIEMLLSLIKTFIPEEVFSSDEFRFMTDYTHHKYLMADGKYFQMGGRNIENSYHMNKNSLTDKYIFRDTDLVLEFAKKNDVLNQSFEDLYNFEAMVTDIDTIKDHQNLDMLRSISENYNIKKSASKYYTYISRAELNEKIKTLYSNVAASTSDLEKLVASGKSISEAYGIYDITKNNPNAEFIYFENLPFVTPSKGRTLGFKYKEGQTINYGKAIHVAWDSSFRNICRVKTGANNHIIVHQAYFAPTRGLTLRLKENIQANKGIPFFNPAPCQKTTMDIVTNSYSSTDLIPVNALGRRQLSAIVKKITIKPENKVRYSEYQGAANPIEKVPSLHTKVMAFGDDVAIGSANLDPRSLNLDSNNAMYIRNAKNLSKSYKYFIDQLESSKLTKSIPLHAFKNKKNLNLEDNQVIKMTIDRYGTNKKTGEKRLTPKQTEAFTAEALSVLKSMDVNTSRVINGIFTHGINATITSDGQTAYDAKYEQL